MIVVWGGRGREDCEGKGRGGYKKGGKPPSGVGWGIRGLSTLQLSIACGNSVIAPVDAGICFLGGGIDGVGGWGDFVTSTSS